MAETVVKKKGFYYGWVVVLAGFLCHFVSTGLLIYTFSLFVVPMTELLQTDRTAIMLASSIYTLCVAIISPIVGGQVAKGRVKLIIILGAILFGGGFLLLSIASTLPLFYIFYAMIGIGCALAGPVVSSALPTAWFDKRRGLAVGITNCGGGVAAIFMPTIVAGIITTSGPQMAFIAIGILAIVLLLVAALLAKPNPQSIGLMPDGLTKEEFDALPQKERPVLIGITRAEAFKTPALWLLCLALVFLGFGQLGMMQNAAAFLTDLKFDMTIAATALGVIGMTSTVGKIFFGWLSDRVNPQLVFCIGNVLLIIGALFLVYTQPDSSLFWLLGYALLFGFGLGCWSSTVPLIIGRLMGVAHFAAIWGIVFGFRTVGDIFGVPGVSAIASASSYQTAFWVAIALFVVSAVFIVITRKPKSFIELEKKEGIADKSEDAA